MKARYLIPVAAVVVVLAALWLVGPFGKESPSIILISVDTLRADHLGCYGYHRKTSPSVDAFAGESMLFSRCFAQAPITRPSCGTIVSGYYPHELKVFKNNDKLPAPVTTVAELLREEGYRTIGVVSNFMLHRGAGFEQGFDYYDDKMDEMELVRRIPSYQDLDGIRSYDHYVAQYDGEIRYFDEHFGRLVAELKALDLYDNSLIIFTADHGEGMGEHDYYFAHGEYVYNSLIHVPLIIRHGAREAGIREDYAQIADIVPTILGAAGVTADGTLHGSDLLEGTPGDRYILSEMPGKYSIIEGGLKLVHHAEADEYFLFDIANDPDEQINLLDDAAYTGRLNLMAAPMAEHLRQDVLGDRVRRNTQRLTREEKERIKALGYVP